MVRVDNFIVTAEFFLPTSEKADFNHTKLKEIFELFLNERHYVEAKTFNPFYRTGFFNTKYTHQIALLHPQISWFDNIKRKFSAITEEDFHSSLYLKRLKSVKSDLPKDVTISISNGTFKDQKGYIVNLRIDPFIIDQISQVHAHWNMNEFDLSLINDKCCQLAQDIISAVHGTIIRAPAPKAIKISSTMLDTFELIQNKELFDLLKRGYDKLNQGNTEDAITDLRSVLEKFVELCAKKVDPQCKTEKIKINLKIITDKVKVDSEVFSKLHDSLYGCLYRATSDENVHERKRISKHDAEYIFRQAEIEMRYLFEKTYLLM